MARPSKPFFAPWLDQQKTGLGRVPDGRWRIVATGERLCEPDERKAVERYLKQTGQAEHRQAFVEETMGTQRDGQQPQWDHEAMGSFRSVPSSWCPRR